MNTIEMAKGTPEAKERVLAYQLATEIPSDELDKIAGGDGAATAIGLTHVIEITGGTHLDTYPD